MMTLLPSQLRTLVEDRPAQDNTLLASVHSARARGWSVIPLIGGADASYGKRAKRAWKNYMKRRASEAEIERWFQTAKSAYGIVCGQVSQLLVIDFDEPDAQ